MMSFFNCGKRLNRFVAPRYVRIAKIAELGQCLALAAVLLHAESRRRKLLTLSAFNQQTKRVNEFHGKPLVYISRQLRVIFWN